jgi:hypothetical protein
VRAELVPLRTQQSAAAVRLVLAPIFPLSAEQSFNCCLAHCSMHRKDCLGGVPSHSRAILSHIASDWPAFADVRAAARGWSQKSRLANALSIADNEVRVALAAALLCTDLPDASAEPEPFEDVESRA